jgi:hypothetical protein
MQNASSFQTALPFSRHLARNINCLAAIGAVFAGLSCAPATAQGNGQSTDTSVAQADKRVSIDAEDATLSSVLTMLLSSVGANYTLDSSLRSLHVTAHLHDLRLKTALDVLLRSVAPPVTYRLEDGVYQFKLKSESALPEPDAVGAGDTPPQSGVRHLQVARVNFIDAAEAALILGGIPIRSTGQTYGLVDPNKLGIVGVSSGAAGGTGNAGNGLAGTNGQAANGQTTNGQNTALPANLFDYLWIVNAGAGF